MGLTIDYGPYAFMDIFNSMHICNHSDEEGRYAYKVSKLGLKQILILQIDLVS